MNLLVYIILLQFATTVTFGQPAAGSKLITQSNQPEALVSSLYHEVVVRHPVGIPKGADMRVLAPYMSKALIHRIDIFLACDADWFRQNPEPHLKAPFGVWESGLFSGVYERTEPKLFSIEKTQLERDGSIRVYVKLTNDDPSGKLRTWRVAVIVLRVNDHYAVDDVIYLKDKDLGIESRLSDGLSAGCDGPRWRGYSMGRRNTPPNFPSFAGYLKGLRVGQAYGITRPEKF